MTNVGTRPSVDDSSDITIETMLADFDQNIYGEKVAAGAERFETGKRDAAEIVKAKGVYVLCRRHTPQKEREK